RSLIVAHINLGCLLQAQAERGAVEGFGKALSHFRTAAEIAPGNADAWINLGYARERQRALEEASACYDRALAIDPELVAARFNRSMVLLARGQWRQGWDDYEWRWSASGFPRPAFRQPEWDGAPLQGETVMLYTEQGFGDAIHFVRY